MKLCIGIDEAGRGPLAGPVTAAAVVLPEDFPRECLNDSKKLSEKKRTAAEVLIKEHALCWAVGWVSHRTIDGINIHYASLLAMERAFLSLGFTSKWEVPVMIDGSYTLSLPHHQMSSIPKGDSLIPEIMAASVLAKNARDRWMVQAAGRYPHWGFDGHKGYPTKSHREAYLTYGASPIHRKSFKVTFDGL